MNITRTRVRVRGQQPGPQRRGNWPANPDIFSRNRNSQCGKIPQSKVHRSHFPSPPTCYTDWVVPRFPGIPSDSISNGRRWILMPSHIPETGVSPLHIKPLTRLLLVIALMLLAVRSYGQDTSTGAL